MGPSCRPGSTSCWPIAENGSNSSLTSGSGCAASEGRATQVLDLTEHALTTAETALESLDDPTSALIGLLADKRSPTRQILSATATARGPRSSEREAPC